MRRASLRERLSEGRGTREKYSGPGRPGPLASHGTRDRQAGPPPPAGAPQSGAAGVAAPHRGTRRFWVFMSPPPLALEPRVQPRDPQIGFGVAINRQHCLVQPLPGAEGPVSEPRGHGARRRLDRDWSRRPVALADELDGDQPRAEGPEAAAAAQGAQRRQKAGGRAVHAQIEPLRGGYRAEADLEDAGHSACRGLARTGAAVAGGKQRDRTQGEEVGVHWTAPCQGEPATGGAGTLNLRLPWRGAASESRAPAPFHARAPPPAGPAGVVSTSHAPSAASFRGGRHRRLLAAARQPPDYRPPRRGPRPVYGARAHHLP